MTNSLRGLFLLSSVLLLVSWHYMIVASDGQFGELDLTSVSLDENNSVRVDDPLYPKAMLGLGLQGRQVYVSLGCISCHTQQVRLEGVGRDLERGWGLRPSMPRDYVRQPQPLLGRFRHGPDLANLGTRENFTEEALHLHLYSPQADSPGSICQPNPFLYQHSDIQGDLSEGAFNLGNGSQIVPTRRARKLVAYLKSLRQDYELPEMPFLVEPEIKIIPAPLPPVVSAASASDDNATSDE